MVDVLREVGKVKRRVVEQQGGFGLVEDDRRGGHLVVQLGDVGGVVAADGKDFHAPKVARPAALVGRVRKVPHARAATRTAAAPPGWRRVEPPRSASGLLSC